MATSVASTAGQGHPYWYEWFVGLNEVVRLLDPNSDVQSVAFQVCGIKGWGDVVVQLKSGRRCYYQVKHTRVEDSLTFGDLVKHDDGGTSLLGSLFASWKSSGLNAGSTRCVLYTNRTSGSRASTSEHGVRRPPLLKFAQWLHAELARANTINEIRPKSSGRPPGTNGVTSSLKVARTSKLHSSEHSKFGLIKTTWTVLRSE